MTGWYFSPASACISRTAFSRCASGQTSNAWRHKRGPSFYIKLGSPDRIESHKGPLIFGSPIVILISNLVAL